MIDKDQTIAIVGAGIGGLSLAIGLARAGFRPKVYEQATELGDVGAGISLSPNAMMALSYLGVDGAVAEAADEPPVQLTRHFQTGEILVSVDRSNTREELGAPYLQMHRADLHALLVRELQSIDANAIVLNHALTTLTEKGAGSAFHLGFANGGAVEADVVIGADGLRSTLRRLVFNEPAPNFSGFVAWRGLVPMEALSECKLTPGSSVFVAPGRLFVRYPVRLGTVQNFVAFAKSDEWADEGWTKTGSTALLRERFGDFHEEVRSVLDAYDQSEVGQWGLFERTPLPAWVNGRIAVLGDAAHPMLPWFGQGAATSIEDAVVMSRAFCQFDTVDEALQRYELARHERVTIVHRESSKGGEQLVAQDPMALKKNVRTEDTLGLSVYNAATVAI